LGFAVPVLLTTCSIFIFVYIGELSSHESVCSQKVRNAYGFMFFNIVCANWH